MHAIEENKCSDSPSQNKPWLSVTKTGIFISNSILQDNIFLECSTLLCCKDTLE